MGTVGIDYSLNSTTVTIVPASFMDCNITFNPNIVNTTGKMIVTLINTN
jgi:hypothetical protein